MVSKNAKTNFILNADDYGLSPLFNRGILDLAEKGTISSVSVMVKRRYISPNQLKKFKNISLGLHLELKEKDTEKEIGEQLRLFQKIFDRLPSHLDGHQHMHLTSANLPNVIKIAQKHGLPVRSRFPEDRKIIRKAGIKTPDDFISWHPDRKPVLWGRLASPRGKTVEMVCHPGHYDKKAKVSYNLQREKELQILKSQEFKKAANKYELINYYAI